MSKLVKIFTGLWFYAYVWKHQVRILVFDNYQTCSVPLNGMGTFCNTKHIATEFTLLTQFEDNESRKFT